MAKKEAQPKHRPAWTRIYGQGGSYTVQQAGSRRYQVTLNGQPQQPGCTCGAGKGEQPGNCPHIIALRECGFLVA